VLLLLVGGLSWFVWNYVHKKISLGMPAQVTHSTAAVASFYGTGKLLSISVPQGPLPRLSDTVLVGRTSERAGRSLS
jgi:hypothetical protein